MPGWKREIGGRLDALIERAVPGVHKAVKWNSPFYGVEGEGWFVSFHCFTRYIKVAFFRGLSLDPVPPGESRSRDTRYLDIHEDGAFDEAQFSAWVKQASQLPGERMLAVFGLVAKLLRQFGVPAWIVIPCAGALQMWAPHPDSYAVEQFAAYFVFFYVGFVMRPTLGGQQGQRCHFHLLCRPRLSSGFS